MSWRLNAGNETEVMDARGRNVARAHCGGPYGVTLDEAEAHARLIAAAPDMLAALEAVLPDLWDGIELATEQSVNEAWLADALHRLDVARAVVNKAKGEA